jgi:hypothetical protein
MEKHICEMLDHNRKLLRDSLQEACDCITPYDVQDMKKVFESQKAMVNDVLAKNSQLVSISISISVSIFVLPTKNTSRAPPIASTTVVFL